MYVYRYANVLDRFAKKEFYETRSLTKHNTENAVMFFYELVNNYLN